MPFQVNFRGTHQFLPAYVAKEVSGAGGVGGGNSLSKIVQRSSTVKTQTSGQSIVSRKAQWTYVHCG